MLNAIGIYNDKCQRIKFAQKNENSLFQSNQLKNLEEKTIMAFLLSQENFYFSKEEDEYHYMQTYPQQKITVGIVSRRELQSIELANLFNNIMIVFNSPTSKTPMTVTLTNIIDNPINYIGRSIRVSKIQQDLDATKEIMFKNIDQVLKRGERLEDLQKRTLDLKLGSREFNQKAQKLNSCCYYRS